MAVHFHSLKITDIKRETENCISVGFEVPDELSAEFLYKEGQNITLKKRIEGEDLRRSYSICTAPYEKELRIAIKNVEGGKFSKFANDFLQAGDTIEVLPPTGKFNARFTKDKAGNYLAIAAGSGITPVISIIKHTLQTQAGSSFTLVYGNKSRGTIIFFEELEGLKNKYMQRFNFVNILSQEKTDSEIFYGRVNEEKLTSLKQFIAYNTFDEIYLCGPEALIFSANNFLLANGIAGNSIHFELFTTPGQTFQKAPAEVVNPVDNSPKSSISIRLDGRSFGFDLSFTGQSILDAALQQGADLPYACKGGVCATCRAKLIEGSVKMDINYALEPEEIEQGFILTCQAHPTTEKVMVDFDIK